MSSLRAAVSPAVHGGQRAEHRDQERARRAEARAHRRLARGVDLEPRGRLPEADRLDDQVDRRLGLARHELFDVLVGNPRAEVVRLDDDAAVAARAQLRAAPQLDRGVHREDGRFEHVERRDVERAPCEAGSWSRGRRTSLISLTSPVRIWSAWATSVSTLMAISLSLTLMIQPW